MTTKAQLDSIISEFNLLNHPFYQAWHNGTLPVEALKVYAEEYGAFVGRVAEGWETTGDHSYAEEERYHEQLWVKFAATMGTTASKEGGLKETRELMEVCSRLFGQYETALGAMYAFEVQQPDTAKSKIDGLRAHYNLGADAEVYFEEHTANHYEARTILERMSRMTPAEQQSSVNACREMCKAMWDVLSGIHGTCPATVN